MVEQESLSRNDRNRDYLKRLNYPKQTYALSGTDWGDASENRTRGKLVIEGAPMIISTLPPGANAYSDEAWQQVYGASMDSYLSIFDGTALSNSVTNALTNFSSVFAKSLPTAANIDIYEILPRSLGQQVQFVTSHSTVEAARNNTSYLFEDNIRSIGLRAPGNMTGWGHTITMRPTDPNPEDKRANDDEHRQDRSTWKTGPLDVRWDERRGVWRAWNDLIIDDYQKGLNTLVFSTNDNDGCGFPWLRAAMADVWTVRKTFEWDLPNQITSAQSNDTTRTGALLTRLTGNVFDATNDGAGPWTDVFKVDIGKGPGTSATCGGETTTDGVLCIKTTANFRKDATLCGPISFLDVPPPDPDLVLGHMYFNGGVWQPGVTIDACDIARTEFDITADNDDNISSAWRALCQKGVNRNHGKIVDVAVFEENTNANIINFLNEIEDWENQFRPNVESAIAAAILRILTNIQPKLQSDFEELVDEINDALDNLAIQLKENCNCDYVPPGLKGPKVELSQTLAIDVAPDLDLSAYIDEAFRNLQNEITPFILTETAGATEVLQINIKDPCELSTTNFTCSVPA